MKPRGDGATLNGFLDKGSRFKGELSFEETFRIDGKFEGTIPSGSELILGDTAEVDAQIRVERIEIHPRARVTADLHAPVLRIEEGAYFQGTCDMSGDTAPKLLEMPGTRK